MRIWRHVLCILVGFFIADAARVRFQLPLETAASAAVTPAPAERVAAPAKQPEDEEPAVRAEIIAAPNATSRIDALGAAVAERAASAMHKESAIGAAVGVAAGAPEASMASSMGTPVEEFAKHPPYSFDWSKTTGSEVTQCFLVLFVFGVLVSAAGIGGGGLFLAALMLVGGISARDAVPISHTITMLGATGSLLINGRGWWVKGSADIDIDTCRMIIPASLLGSLFGFILNNYVSSVAIMKLLVLLLTTLIFLSGRIWWRQRQEEAGVLQPPKTLSVEDLSRQDPASLSEVITALVILIVIDICSVIRFHMNECRSDQVQDLDLWPVSCNHPVLVRFFGQQVYHWLLDPVRSSKFMLATDVVPIFLCILFMVFYSIWMLQEKGWTVQRAVTVQGVGWATGVLCGLVGIGGGLIFSPFFLLSMDPIVAVGTSSTCLLFVAASATLQYAFTDRIIMSLAAVYGLATFLASLVGTTLIRGVRSMLPTGRSFISGIVVFVVFLTNVFAIVKLVMPELTGPIRHKLNGVEGILPPVMG